MMKSVFILHKNRLLGELYNIIIKDFNNLLNLYNFDKIYFVSDGRTNWRKDFFPEYKITRKKNISINWNYVFETFDEIKEEISYYKNCYVYKIDNLEGDDIISYIVNMCNKKNESNIIIANDSDLYQLIKSNTDYINIMYNNQYKKDILFVPTNYKIFINNNINIDNELFGNDNKIEVLNFLKKIIKYYKVVEIDNELETFIKIMGHNKDSIHSVYMIGNKGIGKIGITKVYNIYKNLYPQKIDFNTDDFKKRLLHVIKIYKRVENHYKDSEILKNIDRNIKLTKLDEKNIPTHLYDKMSQIIS